MSVHWAELNENICPCRGSGWGEVDKDVYKKCPIHYCGQLHPEIVGSLENDPTQLSEEEARSYFQYEIEMTKLAIANLQAQLLIEQENLIQLELSEIKCTPTVRNMPVAKVVPELEINEN